MVIGLGGGYDGTLLRAGQRPGPFPAAAVRPLRRPSRPICGLQVTIVEKDCTATAISLGFPIDVLRGSKAMVRPGGGQLVARPAPQPASHLYQVIREQRGLNYGDYTYIERFPGGRAADPAEERRRRRQIFEIWIRPVPNEGGSSPCGPPCGN